VLRYDTARDGRTDAGAADNRLNVVYHLLLRTTVITIYKLLREVNGYRHFEAQVDL